MSIPFPIGLIAGGKDKLTRITFNTLNYGVVSSGGGFEDETDADGGANLQTFTFATPNSNNSIDQDLSALNILWDDRYNYRLGFANVYSINSIKLYKNGVLTETQAGVPFDYPAHRPRHVGTNLDTGSRNVTEVDTGYPQAYPK